jgi:subtilisin family serine protease
VMSSHVAGRRRPARLVFVALVAVAVAATTAGAARAEAPSTDTQLYLVQVAGAPVASYDGDVAGLAATRPADGKRVDSTSSATRAYRSHLRATQRETLVKANIAESRRSREYAITFNGYAATLTSSEVDRLSRTKGVVRVWKNEILASETTTTPAFLGLSGSNGAWAKQFGDVSKAGQGVIVGVIDSGFWPENPSFAALTEPRPDAATITAKFHGTCDVGSEEQVACNNKVLGARYYNASGLQQDFEFNSPRDYNGHGSHTASTAAGNNNVAATINGGDVGSVSGMAPAARLSIYKALWHNAVTGGANAGTADLVAAIDDAVADGVDVINYSISGSSLYVVDPVEIAFLSAAAAGVFVAASAGNAGDTVGVSSVAHNAPWTTTVAASTHDRGVNKTVALATGATYPGVGVGPGVGTAPLVDAATAGLPGVAPAAAALCFSDADADPSNGVQPALDPAKVGGRIVLCERGTNARIDKSLAVANGGGKGMIQFNPAAGQSLNADFHSVPSIHVDNVAGAAIKAYAATAGATASISAVSNAPVRAPAMAGFSSFGPALAGGGDLLKPDITAPGVDVIAAVAPPANAGNNFNAFSGTSMASPHIAGIAALLASKYPSWSPARIKSAIMTTAAQTDNTGAPIQGRAGDATPLDFGSGHVRPANAFDPGLVFDSGEQDWLKYACGINQLQLITDASVCASIGSIDPSNLNYPSISVGDLAGKQTITRRVTNVGKGVGIYTPTMQAPPGFTATVSPQLLLLLPGGSATFRVTLTRTSAAFGQFAFGSITWTDTIMRGNHVVRSPIVVRPVALAAPVESTFTGSIGNSTLTVTPGFSGTLNSSSIGLVPDTKTTANLDTSGAAFNSANPAASSRTSVVTVSVPAGTDTARFATFDADHPAGTDVDLYVYRVNGVSRVLVGTSAGGTADEVVTLTSPTSGTYEAYVDLFAIAGGTAATVTHHSWILQPTAAGNLTVTPASQAVTTGTAKTLTVRWNGLTPATRYLGAVLYADGTTAAGRTFVRVDA